MRQNPRMADEIFGRDIALNNEGQARVAANGELILTDGVDTGVQDIVLRIFTRLGQLFMTRNSAVSSMTGFLRDPRRRHAPPLKPK